MANFPLLSNSAVLKRVAGIDQAANTEITDVVPAGSNEVQTITGTPSATFALIYDGTTGPTTLTTTATAADVQAYMRANFPAVGPDGVTCTGGPLATTINVTYNGLLTSYKNVPILSVAGGVTGLTFATTTQGSRPVSWYLLSASVACVQGATQTPQPILVIDDGTNVVFESFGSSAAQAVSTTCRYTWAPGLSLSGQVGATTNVHSTAPLPEGLVLLPGWRISTNTIGKGANTDYGAASYLVCELG
jgi:hypothetical protein